jgi:hypothetical protein
VNRVSLVVDLLGVGSQQVRIDDDLGAHGSAPLCLSVLSTVPRADGDTKLAKILGYLSRLT